MPLEETDKDKLKYDHLWADYNKPFTIKIAKLKRLE